MLVVIVFMHLVFQPSRFNCSSSDQYTYLSCVKGVFHNVPSHEYTNNDMTVSAFKQQATCFSDLSINIVSNDSYTPIGKCKAKALGKEKPPAKRSVNHPLHGWAGKKAVPAAPANNDLPQSEARELMPPRASVWRCNEKGGWAVHLPPHRQHNS